MGFTSAEKDVIIFIKNREKLIDNKRPPKVLSP